MNKKIVFLLLALFPLISFAQSSLRTISARLPTNDEVAARLAELSSDKAPLPDNPAILYDLNSRYEEELSTYRRALLMTKPVEGSIGIEKAKMQTTAAIRELMVLDCKTTSKDTIKRLRKSLTDSYKSISETIFKHDLEGDDPWMGEDGEPVLRVNTCDATKDFIGDTTRQEEIISFFDTVKEKY